MEARFGFFKTGAKNLFVICMLLFMTFSFSGCSIRKADRPEGYNKSNNEQRADTDGDGLRDSEEKELGTDPGKKDTDNDELPDYDEVRQWGTDPNKADTDGDGYKDGEEVSAGYDPESFGQLDTDRDGLGNVDEKKLGTDPNKIDTDGDGFTDKEEVDMKRNPLTKGE